MKHNWEYKTIEDCFVYIKNGANIKQEKGAVGFPITRIETLSNGVFNRSKMGYANILELGKYALNVLNDGDLLMSHINSKTYVGRTVLYEALPNEVIIHGMNLLRLIPNETTLPKFFYYITLSHYFKSKIVKIRKDAVNQSSFSITDLKKILIPVPQMEVQQQIVAELDMIQEMIDGYKAQIADLDALAQSIFLDTFGDPATNPKGWEISTIGDVASVQTGATPSREIGEYYIGNIPWVKTTEVQNCNIYETEEHISQNALKNSNCKLFPLDTIIVAMYGQGKTRGQIARLKIEACTNQACAAILPCSKLHPLFLYTFLHLSYESLRSIAVGCNQKNLNLSLVKNYKIFLPPISLQNELTAKIEAIEEQKRLIESSIKDLESLYASRMDYWFN